MAMNKLLNSEDVWEIVSCGYFRSTFFKDAVWWAVLEFEHEEDPKKVGLT